ncbi:COG4315 family predicted lipoprotein [Specibacter sp. RAF43]|uniref:COG4315 family predicted lipoprotein n=1 Tax=Specibacter sp. RAF43 TaxID=3233057 RepID=UPI003F9C1270
MKARKWPVLALALLAVAAAGGCSSPAAPAGNGHTTATTVATPTPSTASAQSTAPPSTASAPSSEPATQPASRQAAPPAAAPVLKTASASLGTVVVNGRGLTVYVFDHDQANAGSSTCFGSCIALWPAVTTTEATPRVAGVTGTVGTIIRPDGARQVTLNGLPLYTYAPDAKPGDVMGQGFGGIWWVVAADGTKMTSVAGGGGGSGY